MLVKNIAPITTKESLKEILTNPESNLEGWLYLPPTFSDNFEKGIVKILQKNNKQLFQATLEKVSKGENQKVKIKTTLGEMIVPKSLPISMRPKGFRISPSFQEHMCRLGSKLVFSEANEELWQFLEIDVSDKQVKRICHCYEEKLDELNWDQCKF